MIFRYLPDAEIAWRDVWVGGGLTALLFTVGKSLIGLYLGKSSVSSAFGAAGSLVVILLWVYYSSQILFFGAELTQVYACRYGREIEPSPHAIRVKRVTVTGEEADPREDRREVREAREERRRKDREDAPSPILRNAAVVAFVFLVLRRAARRGRRSDPAET